MSERTCPFSFFARICRSRTFFAKIMHRIRATYRVMHFVGMFDFASDTYFNRRGRRSKGMWLFAGDQNLIFIQSGGANPPRPRVSLLLLPPPAFRFLANRVFALSKDRIEKFTMGIFARDTFIQCVSGRRLSFAKEKD